MKISIHDYANGRLIIGQVPHYLADANASNDDIALAILQALGLNEDECEYMIGGFETILTDHNADSSRDARGIELLVQDFKRDALAALVEITDSECAVCDAPLGKDNKCPYGC